jgi:hypothetical protein
MPAFAKGCEAYHWAWAEYIQNAPTQTLRIGRYLPISSFDKSQMTKTTKRKTKAAAKKTMVITTKTRTATRSERALEFATRVGIYWNLIAAFLSTPPS